MNARLQQTLWFLKAAAKCALQGAQANVQPDKAWMLRLTQQYLYAAAQGNTWATMYWRGRKILKCPTDLWMYCEIIQKVRPFNILETGTYEGGSAMFLYDMAKNFCPFCEVTTIDIAPLLQPDAPIKSIIGSSTEVSLSNSLWDIVILDSNHSYQHVLKELCRFGHKVRSGGYLIVEDTAADYVDGGPAKAVREYMKANPTLFRVDTNCERLGLTFNPGGYLERL